MTKMVKPLQTVMAIYLMKTSNAMQYIEAPNYSVLIDRLPPRECLFLAGSITGVGDWQSRILKHKRLEGVGLLDLFNVFNPRRADFDATQKGVEHEQITWEYHCIHKCERILFWFAEETLAPITLFELGSALNTHRVGNIYIGIHPDYKRKNDIIIQTKLRCEALSNSIVYSIEELAEQVIEDEMSRRNEQYTGTNQNYS